MPVQVATPCQVGLIGLDRGLLLETIEHEGRLRSQREKLAQATEARDGSGTAALLLASSASLTCPALRQEAEGE